MSVVLQNVTCYMLLNCNFSWILWKTIGKMLVKYKWVFSFQEKHAGQWKVIYVLCIQQQFHLYITEWVLLPLCCKCTLEIGWHIVTPVLFLSKILTQWENSGQVERRCRMINPVGHLEDSSWWLWWGLFRGPAECLSCYINEDFWKTEKLWRGLHVLKLSSLPFCCVRLLGIGIYKWIELGVMKFSN